MKSDKLFKILFTMMVAIPVSYILLNISLIALKLTFTNFTLCITMVVELVLSFIVFIASYQNSHDKYKSSEIDSISSWGVGLGIINIVIMLVVIVFILMVPEHFVKKDGRIMAAHVNSYTSVYVEYYDIKTKLIRGINVKIDEYIGKGGYDPFENGGVPEAKRAIYFDDNGKVIKTIE